MTAINVLAGSRAMRDRTQVVQRLHGQLHRFTANYGCISTPPPHSIFHVALVGRLVSPDLTPTMTCESTVPSFGKCSSTFSSSTVTQSLRLPSIAPGSRIPPSPVPLRRHSSLRNMLPRTTSRSFRYSRSVFSTTGIRGRADRQAGRPHRVWRNGRVSKETSSDPRITHGTTLPVATAAVKAACNGALIYALLGTFASRTSGSTPVYVHYLQSAAAGQLCCIIQRTIDCSTL